jgi:hypothetical protein
VAVPATAPTAPGCTGAIRPRPENTRPRLDRCSAHRIRPQRPHRPRSRPVFGPPLRQLASDPFHPVEGGSCNDYDYVCGDPVNGLDLDGRCGFFGNPFKRCNPKDDPSPYGPKFFCGNVGCIAYQTNPDSGYVQWGITTFNGGRGFWSVTVFVNGSPVDSKPLYIKGIPHGRLPRSIAPPGSVVTIEATFVFNCYLWIPCKAHNVRNAYVVPR